MTMINIGYIQFITITGGGKDADGNRIPAVDTPGPMIACNIDTLTKEYRFIVDGDYRYAAYSIYIDNAKLNGVNVNSFSKIQLTDSNQVDLGVHQIINVEPIKLMKQTKVVV